MKLGIYPGSFNPYHKGHHDIFLKAEKIFDKVILARGVNLEKGPSEWEMPKIMKDKLVTSYSGLLTDFVKEIAEAYGEMPTIIRGLRNAADLQYEITQFRYLQDLMPEIQMVSIFCDNKFEHISSSGIRMLSKYGADKIRPYLLD